MAKPAPRADYDVDRLLVAPMYTIAEASRLVGLTRSRVSRWLHGYEFRYSAFGGVHVSQMPAVVRAAGPGSAPYASFLDLVDLLFVKQFIEAGLSLQRVRAALDEATDLLGSQHFARKVFFTDGNAIYLQLDARGDAIQQLLAHGQWVIAPIIVEMAEKIDFEGAMGFARRWYPMGKDQPIVIDPMVSFGRPCLVGRGITTSNVYDLYLGENLRIEPVARWMDIRQEEAEAAVDFERQLAA